MTFFIFAINTENDKARPAITNENIAYVVSANNNIPLFNKYFEDLLKHRQLKSAMVATIEYASTVDPSISKNYDFVTVD